MKHHISILFFRWLLLLLPFSSATAQTFTQNYINSSVTIRSDFPSKSVLVSNLYSDKSGNMSSIIGAASWADSGKQLQCRSLLEFNYLFMPHAIMNDPSLIISAELVLFPVQVTANQNDLNKTSRFIVRRVLADWAASATKWSNQPEADSSMQVKEFLKKKQKNKPVSVDVTGQVMDMIRYGNNGFMICHEPTNAPNMTLSQWFASPKNEDENKRPLLVIKYKQLLNPSLSFKQDIDIDAIQRQLDMKMTNAGTAPVAEPVKTNPVKD